MSASASSTSLSTVSTPSGFLRSTPIERRPRFSTSSRGRSRRVAADARSAAVDAHDVGAHVGEHHGAERPGADARDLDDAISGERSGHRVSSSVPRRCLRLCPRSLGVCDLGDFTPVNVALMRATQSRTGCTMGRKSGYAMTDMTTTNELPKDAWDAVLAAGETREYRRGAWIFVEGDPPGPALAVIEGEVRVEATREGFALELGVFGVGSLFGELSAIDGRPRSASAIATETTRLAAVGIPEFNQLLTQHPTLAAAMLRVMATRLRATTTFRGRARSEGCRSASRRDARRARASRVASRKGPSSCSTSRKASSPACSASTPRA